MSIKDPNPAPADGDDLSPAELNLGKALAVIHRVFPWLDEPRRATEVQAGLRKVAAWIESARAAHAQAMPDARAGLSPEIAAVIAAAVALHLDRSHRLLSVQPASTPPPYLNVWAIEGRTQIFQGRKVR